MQSGKLRHRITIERPIETQDASTGAIAVSWSLFASRISAEVLPDRASEYFAAQQLQSSTNAMIRIRYRVGVEPTMRVTHHLSDGIPEILEVYDIQGVVHFQAGFREIRLMCLKRDAEGFRRGADVVNP